MNDNMAGLRRKIGSAKDLQSVVRTMKAMAASSIGQYENAVRSLDDYYQTVQLGLSVCLRQTQPQAANTRVRQKETGATGVVVFGSDQGLVGQFNDVMVEFVSSQLENLPGKKIVWAVGDRIQSHLESFDLMPGAHFVLPNSIGTITPLVGQILMEIEAQREQGVVDQVYLFHHRPKSRATYQPVSQRLLPLDDVWRRDLAAIAWPTPSLPEVIHNREVSLLAFVREYIFVSLFRACAESLASENASRLVAMQRAEKNIDELLGGLNQTFYRIRQGAIDAELFDLVAGFEALAEV